MGTLVSPTTVAASFASNDEMTELLDMMGMTSQEFAELVCDVITFDVKSVTVNGDSATLVTTLTTPDFTELDTVMDGLIEEMFGEVDVDNMTEEELGQLFADLMRATLTSPDLPTESTDFDIDYVKANGKWTMEDSSDVASAIGNVTSTL